MHHSLLHRRFLVLAWLAMLLVLCAPLVSRWMAPLQQHAPRAEPSVEHGVPSHAQHAEGAYIGAVPPGHAHHHDMAAHGDHHAPAAGEALSVPMPAADPHADHEMGVDCDYCLIAARLITLLVAALLLLAPLAPVCRARVGAVRMLPAPLAGTLGARGPPVLLA